VAGQWPKPNGGVRPGNWAPRLVRAGGVNHPAGAAVLGGKKRLLGEIRMTAPGMRRPKTARWRLAAIGLLAVGVATTIYVVGRLHQPDYTFSLFGPDPFPAKSLLATIALALGGVQVLLALWMYRKLPLAGAPPRPVPLAHRATGAVIFALTVPVAVHCLIAYGVQLTSARRAIHSIAGCFFYGAFAAKVLAVHSRRLPGWVLPVAGGTLAVVLGVLWYTSALWYYNGFQLPHL
jgi:uncharacterized protein DUF6529